MFKVGRAVLVAVAAIVCAVSCGVDRSEPPGLNQTYQRPTGSVGPDVAGRCASGTLADRLRHAVVQGHDIVLGTITPTGRVVTAVGDQPAAYTEFDATFERLNSKDRVVEKVYVLGGTDPSGGRTIVDEEMQTAWSPAGGVFGLLVADPELGPVLVGIPATPDAVQFPPLGCWNTAGAGRTVEATYLRLADGSIQTVSGPAVEIPLTQIRETAGP